MVVVCFKQKKQQPNLDSAHACVFELVAIVVLSIWLVKLRFEGDRELILSIIDSQITRIIVTSIIR